MSEIAEQFKTAFRHHPAGISLITATSPAGPVGLTASSLASVGLDPVAVVFSVTRRTGSAGAILRADTFLIHLLDTRHIDVAKQFSVTGGERFTSAQGWRTLDSGEPHLTGARAALRCRALRVTPVGSSAVVIAEVIEIIAGGSSDPLVYIDRSFRSLS